MKKIVFIPGIVDSVIGGAEMQMQLLAEALEDADCDIYGILLNIGNNTQYNNLFLSNRNYPKIFKMKQLFSKKIFNYLCEIKPDIIYQRGGLSFLSVATYYCKKHSCKVIWHIADERSVKPFQFEWKKSILFDYIDKKFLEYGIKNTDYVIGQAKYQDELLRKNYGRRCDLIVLNSHPMPKQKIKKEEAPIKVVWIANFKKLKQPGIFIKLAEKFKDYKKIRFIMIGKQGQKTWQAELASRIDKLNNLEYLGEKPIDEVKKILSESHIFVNTSKYEGFPNTFIQAWMRKVPVVSLNVDPDNILEKECIGFHSRNISNMVKDLKKLISDKNLREKMGERAQKYAFKNHTIEKNVKKIVRFFEE